MKKNKYYFCLAVISLIIFGFIFFFWKKSKSQIKSDFSSFQENEIDKFNPHRYSDYEIPLPSPEISEKEAKKEVVKAIWEWGARDLTKSEVEKILLKNNSEMDYKEDGKIEKNFTLIERINHWEKFMQKYQKEVFSNLPNQSEFEQQIIKTQRIRNFYALYNPLIERKNNNEIDWITTQKKFYKGKKKPKDKKQIEKKIKEIKDHIEREINNFTVYHAKEFPKLTNLEELNQWANLEAQKKTITNYLLWKLWKNGKKIKKKLSHSKIIARTAIQKNKNLNLSWKIIVYELKEMK